MKRFIKIGKVCALLSAIVLCIPIGAMARASEPTRPPVQQRTPAVAPAKVSMDVIANSAGELRGAVVNADTAPSVNAKVVLCMVNGKDPQTVTTDASGRFLFKNVRPGMYTLAVNGAKGQAQKLARVWTEETAPPAATPVALVSLQDEQPRQETDLVRGQAGGGGGGLLVGALVVGGIAAAIAIPIAVSNANKTSSP